MRNHNQLRIPQIDPEAALTPTQHYVWSILHGRPGGACRRDFADFDVFEVSNRISEIEQRLGITIQRAPCEAHSHRRRIIRYSL